MLCVVCFLQTYQLNLHSRLQLPVPEKCKALKPHYCDVSLHLEDVNDLWRRAGKQNRLNVYCFSWGLAECHIPEETCPVRPESLLQYGCLTSFWQCEKSLKNIKMVFAVCLCSTSLTERWYTVPTTVLYMTGKIWEMTFPHLFLEMQTN